MSQAHTRKAHAYRSPFALVGLLIVALAPACGGAVGASATAPPGIVRVGEKGQVAQIGLTVNSVERKGLIGEASRPGDGNVFLVIDLTIDNGTDHKIPYTRYHFTLVDAARRVYEPAAVPGQERPLLASDLDAKKDVSGIIVFRIPASIGPLELVYHAPGSPHPLRVDLG